jgi:hypothetical protein
MIVLLIPLYSAKAQDDLHEQFDGCFGEHFSTNPSEIGMLKWWTV